MAFCLSVKPARYLTDAIEGRPAFTGSKRDRERASLRNTDETKGSKQASKLSSLLYILSLGDGILEEEEAG
jgi:hypothetical protein